MQVRVLTTIAAAVAVAATVSACQRKANESANVGNASEAAAVGANTSMMAPESAAPMGNTPAETGNAMTGNAMEAGNAMGNTMGNTAY